jgi:hypothetical protein
MSPFSIWNNKVPKIWLKLKIRKGKNYVKMLHVYITVIITHVPCGVYWCVLWRMRTNDITEVHLLRTLVLGLYVVSKSKKGFISQVLCSLMFVELNIEISKDFPAPAFSMFVLASWCLVWDHIHVYCLICVRHMQTSGYLFYVPLMFQEPYFELSASLVCITIYRMHYILTGFVECRSAAGKPEQYVCLLCTYMYIRYLIVIVCIT